MLRVDIVFGMYLVRKEMVRRESRERDCIYITIKIIKILL